MEAQADRASSSLAGGPPARSFIRHRRGEVICFDIGAPGLRDGIGGRLFAVGFVSSMVLPLAVFGIVGGISFTDFGAVRLPMLLFGTAALLGCVVPILWLFARGWLWRERVQLSPAGVVVRTGFPFYSRRWTSSVLDAIVLEIAAANVGEWRNRVVARERLRMKLGDLELCLVAGLSRDDLEGLRKQVLASAAQIEATVEEPLVEWAHPLGWGVRRAAGQLARDILRPLRQPLPFLIFDVVTLVGVFLFEPAFLAYIDVREVYPYLFGAFLLGALARRFDSSFMGGMRHYRAKSILFELCFPFSGALIGLGAGLALLDRFEALYALTIPPFLGGAVCVLLMRGMGLRDHGKRAAQLAEVPRVRRWYFELFSGSTLLPLAVLHEHFTFKFFDGTSRGLGIMALPMLLPVLGAVYLPVRIHYFIDDPEDRSNAIWFAITVVLLSAYAVFGVALF